MGRVKCDEEPFFCVVWNEIWECDHFIPLLTGVCSCHFRIHYHRRPAGTMGILLMIAIL